MLSIRQHGLRGCLFIPFAAGSTEKSVLLQAFPVRLFGDFLGFILTQQESFHNLGIEMGAGFFPDDVDGGVKGETVFVAAACDQRVEGILNGHDPGGERNFFTLEALRIAFSVPAFVMIQGQVTGLFQIIGGVVADHADGAVDDLGAAQSMALHLGEFLIREFPGFVQQRIRNLNLSDVVERCAVFHFKQIAVGELILVFAGFTHLLHDQLCVCGGIADVVAGALVTAFHQIRQNHDQTVLKFGDLFVFLLGVVDVGDRIFRHLSDRVIQVFNLISGLDIQRPNLIQAVFSSFIALRRKGGGNGGNLIDGLYDFMLCRISPDGQNQNEEAEEEREF